MTRPSLIIERGESRGLGNCYTSFNFLVTSTKALGLTELEKLQALGFLGYGQEFYALQILEGGTERAPVKLAAQQKPTGYDVTITERKDRYGVPMEPREIREPYFVYAVEARVDSSD